jgi:hypothetical protein
MPTSIEDAKRLLREARRVPLEDLRVIYRVWGDALYTREFYVAPSFMTNRGTRRFFRDRRVRALVHDPHDECDHTRTICLNKIDA